MVYVQRKVLYPLFIGAFAVIFFSLIYIIAFSQSLSIQEASIELKGQSIEFTSVVENISGHYVRDIELLVKMDDKEIVEKIDFLAPNEKVDVLMELPFSSDLHYDVYLVSPFNKTIYLYFDLDEKTINPVNVVVKIASEMTVGKEYGVVVTLCNESSNNLYDVEWLMVAPGNYFEDNVPTHKIDLPVNKCKYLYPSLFPINPGQVEMDFILKIGTIEKRDTHKILISGNNGE